jgi:hypothetical protein
MAQILYIDAKEWENVVRLVYVCLGKITYVQNLCCSSVGSV